MGVDAGEVDRGAGELVLKAGLGQPTVAGSAQTAALDSLGHGALNPRPNLVALLPGIGLLLGPGRLERGMLVAAT